MEEISCWGMKMALRIAACLTSCVLSASAFIHPGVSKLLHYNQEQFLEPCLSYHDGLYPQPMSLNK